MSVSKNKRWLMFNQIAKTYDFINRLITFGMDINWRNRMIDQLPKPCGKLLDIASGTMDVAITAAKKRPDIKSIIAMDMAENMLDIGMEKSRKLNLGIIEKTVADIHKLPFEAAEFEAATVSFGIRNFEHLDQAFAETFRVIKESGDFIILESCQPINPIMKFLNGIYLNTWVRLMGILFSGHGDSYGYLAKSIQTFYSPEQLRDMLLKTGFKKVNIQYFMFQSVQLIHAIK